MITDEQRLISATRNGHAIPVYDDGFGTLFIHRGSMGISGIVRAQTWEDAYSICEDEFFPAGDEDAISSMNEIEEMEEGIERSHAQACWDEAYGYRHNGGLKMPDGSVSYIYAKDMNGDSLDSLTPELAQELNIVLELQNWEDAD